MSTVLQGVLGYVVFLLLALLMSENRRAIRWRYVGIGIGVQLILAILVFTVPGVQLVLQKLGGGILLLKEATLSAAQFMFGYLAGGPAPFELKPGADTFIFAFQPLPMIMVFSAVVMLLFHWGILPAIMRALTGVFRRVFGLGGALGVACAGKMFVGQIETALLIKPYLEKLKRHELFTLLTLGMATASGTVVAVYLSILQPAFPQAVTHILATFLLSIPAALLLSQIIVPPQDKHTEGDLKLPFKFGSSLEAVAQGTSDGLRIVVNVGAFLLVSLALIILVDNVLMLIPDMGFGQLSLAKIFGWLFSPLAWLMGIPWEEAGLAGELIGVKTVMNEIIAFMQMAKLSPEALSSTTKMILIYALCGFSNFASIGVVVGGVGSMCPSQRALIITFGFKAMIAGAIASCLSGTVAGLCVNLASTLL